MLFEQFNKKSNQNDDLEVSDGSFHSAQSCEEIMKCNADPFIPSLPLQPEISQPADELEVMKQVGNQLQEKLDK